MDRWQSGSFSQNANRQLEKTTFQVTGNPTLPANLCPFSWRREVTCFDEDFGEAVGEAVEANASSVV